MRLVGFNTPETIEPRCAAERALGQKAKARLRQLVSKGRASVERVRCSCKPGTEGTNACNHGRSCGVLRVDGRDVGDILISEGLAVPFGCGVRSCPPTPRPWCG
jgi:endonuclease YncB( thermonuclease family)